MNYLDANIFIYALTLPKEDPKAIACYNILNKIINKKIKAYTSLLSWDEVVYITRKILGREISKNEGRKFLNFPNLTFIRVDENIVIKAQRLTEKYNLDPRDAIHAATALVNNIHEIISDDSDFDKIKEIKRKEI